MITDAMLDAAAAKLADLRITIRRRDLRSVLAAALAKAEADLYWLASDGETYGPDPQSMVDDESIDPEIGEVLVFTCAMTLPAERWQYMDVEDGAPEMRRVP
jgi:hypothetical protein